MRSYTFNSHIQTFSEYDFFLLEIKNYFQLRRFFLLNLYYIAYLNTFKLLLDVAVPKIIQI